MKTQTKTTKSGSRKGKSNTKQKRTPTFEKAAHFARSLSRQYGPVTVVRATAQKFGTLRRRDVLHIASTLGINQGTAARQYQEVRGPHRVRVVGL